MYCYDSGETIWYFKVIALDRKHGDITYPAVGETVRLKEPFNSNPFVSCCGGGLYITDLQSLPHFLDFGDIILGIKLSEHDPEFKMVEDPSEPTKYRVNMFKIVKEWSLKDMETYVIFGNCGINLLRWYACYSLELCSDNPSVLENFLSHNTGKIIASGHFIKVIDPGTNIVLRGGSREQFFEKNMHPNISYFLHWMLVLCEKKKFMKTKEWIVQTYASDMNQIMLSRSLSLSRIPNMYMLMLRKKPFKGKSMHTKFYELMTDNFEELFGKIYMTCINYYYDPLMRKCISAKNELTLKVVYHRLPYCLDAGGWSKILSQIDTSEFENFWARFFTCFSHVKVPVVEYLIHTDNMIVFTHLLRLQILDQPTIDAVLHLIKRNNKWLTPILEESEINLPLESIDYFIREMPKYVTYPNINDARAKHILERVTKNSVYSRRLFSCVADLSYEKCIEFMLQRYPEDEKDMLEYLAQLGTKV